MVVETTRECGKPVLCCFMGDEMVVGARKVLHGNGIPMFTFPELIGRIFGLMGRYQAWLEKEKQEETSYTPVKNQQTQTTFSEWKRARESWKPGPCSSFMASRW